MKQATSYFFDYAELDFDGGSFNGDSLMATLERIGPEAAGSEGTYEGYSAWSIAIHVAYFKHFLAKSILGEERVGAFPFQADKHGFAPKGSPMVVSEGSWRDLKAYLRKIHAQMMEAVRGLDESALEREMPGWEMPYGTAVAWVLGHDGYHTAQIRSMGVPGLAKD